MIANGYNNLVFLVILFRIAYRAERYILHRKINYHYFNISAINKTDKIHTGYLDTLLYYANSIAIMRDYRTYQGLANNISDLDQHTFS